MTKVQRYKVGYYTDEWGMSSNTPCLIPDDNGYAVKFEDYCKLEAENERLERNKEFEMTKILIEIDTDTQQVVPVEPTEEMAWVAARHYESDEYTGVRSTYKAMLAAAPQPEPVDADLRRDVERKNEWNRKIRDLVDNLLKQAGYAADSSARNLLSMMNFDAAMPQGEQK